MFFSAREGVRVLQVLEEIVEEDGSMREAGSTREYVLYEEATDSTPGLLLGDEWLEMHLEPGTRVNLIGPEDQINKEIIRVTRETQVLMIVRPELAVQVTKIIAGFFCRRRACLSERISASIETRFESLAPLFGSLIHLFVERALELWRFDIETLMSVAESVIKRSALQLWGAGQDENSALAVLFGIIEPLQRWASSNIRFDRDQDPCEQASRVITGVLKTEQKIWSAKYGLRGIVDCVVKVSTRNGTEDPTLCALEIKSSKQTNSLSHRAQVLLYTLLVAESYCHSRVYGAIYYVKGQVSAFIDLVFEELRSLLVLRAMIVAKSGAEVGNIPPIIDNEYICRNCEFLNECVIHHLVFEDKDIGKKKIVSLTDLGDNLNASDRLFIKRWLELLDVERQFSQKKAIYGCYGDNNMSFCPFSLVPGEHGLHSTQSSAVESSSFLSSVQKTTPNYTYCFKHCSGKLTPEADIYIIGSRVSVKQNVYSHSPVLSGTIVSCADGYLLISSHRQIILPSECLNSTQHVEKVKFFILVDEIIGSEGTAESILLSLFSGKPDFQKLKELVVYSRSPRFFNMPPVDEGMSMLNCDQQLAVRKVESALDYVLILGMPGTGKSSVIVEIISRLLKKNHSVLLSCYTHNAIDHILLKLLKSNIKFLRLCNKARANTKIQPYCDEVLSEGLSVKELDDLYMSTKLVAVTCLGINHPIFKKRVFDYCIVDESSQISLPVSLGPLRYSKIFVLVGDLYQLPPLVSSQKAYNSGLGISLFKRLSEHHPESLVRLRLQYRMNQDIMSLSNHIVYSGKLQCATPDVADREFHIPSLESSFYKLHLLDAERASASEYSSSAKCSYNNDGATCWIAEILKPETRVIFVNIDPSQSMDAIKVSKVFSCTPSYEAAVTMRIAGIILESGISLPELAIITPYRMQIRLMAQYLPGNIPLNMHTVDRFQGSDCECVILSISSAPRNKSSNHLLSDWRRLNVALTRAKSKFIVVGSFSLMSKTPCLDSLLGHVLRMGWFINIGLDAPHVEPGVKLISQKRLSQLTFSASITSQSRKRRRASAKFGVEG